jgi:uracil-DNA glycosylase
MKLPDPTPVIRTKVPAGARIAVVGDFPRKTDLKLGLPFMGSDGVELTKILQDAGIERRQCFFTTVFKHAVPENKIENICAKKAEVGGKDYKLPFIKSGKYVRPEYLAARTALRDELRASGVNVVVALGAVATWALLDNPKITVIRGTVNESTLVPGLKVLPTHHPATIFAQYKYRVVAVLDFAKALKESLFPEIRRPKRQVWIEPTIADIRKFKAEYLDSAPYISYDIETAAKQITCIGFAPNADISICIPFVDDRKPNNSYWETEAEELEAWELVREILQLPAAKESQNGMYDKQYLFILMGIAPTNDTEDTMLMHHAMQPELEKGLGFLGSVYTNEAAWKQMRKRKSTDKTIKADE